MARCRSRSRPLPVIALLITLLVYLLVNDTAASFHNSNGKLSNLADRSPSKEEPTGVSMRNNPQERKFKFNLGSSFSTWFGIIGKWFSSIKWPKWLTFGSGKKSTKVKIDKGSTKGSSSSSTKKEIKDSPTIDDSNLDGNDKQSWWSQIFDFFTGPFSYLFDSVFGLFGMSSSRPTHDEPPPPPPKPTKASNTDSE